MLLCLYIIDGVFKSADDQVKEANEQLMRLVKRDSVFGDPLLPRYYYVPAEYMDAEKCDPGSTPKVASQEGSDYNCVFLMGQSLFIIAQLLTSELLHINELDPIRRYMPSVSRPRKTGRYSAFQVIQLITIQLFAYRSMPKIIEVVLLAFAVSFA